jgi:hypothetical protein
MHEALSGKFAILLLLAPSMAAWAEQDPYEETIEIFKEAGESGNFFDRAYGYSVFPTAGRFSPSTQARPVAITAGASATASTSGGSAGAIGGQRDANNVGGFQRGMATFTVTRGGLINEASVGGARFTLQPVSEE